MHSPKHYKGLIHNDSELLLIYKLLTYHVVTIFKRVRELRTEVEKRIKEKNLHFFFLLLAFEDEEIESLQSEVYESSLGMGEKTPKT